MATVEPRPVPVVQVINIQERWRAWATGAVVRPTYDELWAAAQGDIAVLAAAALGNVQAAFAAGHALGQGYADAYTLALRGLDLLDNWQARVDRAERLAATGAPVPEADLNDELARALEQALGYRERALQRMAEARGIAEQHLAVPDTAARQAAALQSTVTTPTEGAAPHGPPPPPPPTLRERVQLVEAEEGQLGVEFFENLP